MRMQSKQRHRELAGLSAGHTLGSMIPCTRHAITIRANTLLFSHIDSRGKADEEAMERSRYQRHHTRRCSEVDHGQV
ncbi:unnamed protein product [Strongylus vulgaris]|uniref:Uncharacterized protein n=1 Tax=Strongylus vulgaris TaxID=40348 RepID=A0A3P7I6W9_STRVU|nr:unnamed protein product [Strongylus vulgaris]